MDEHMNMEKEKEMIDFFIMNHIMQDDDDDDR